MEKKEKSCDMGPAQPTYRSSEASLVHPITKKAQPSYPHCEESLATGRL